MVFCGCLEEVNNPTNIHGKAPDGATRNFMAEILVMVAVLCR